MHEPARESVKDSAPASGATAKESAVKDPSPAVKDTVPAPAKDSAPSAPRSAAPAAKESAPASAAAKESPSAQAARDSAPAPASKESIPAPTKASAPSAPRPRPAPSPSAPTAETDPAPVPKSKLGRVKGTTGIAPPPRVRRARLKIANIDPWSVMKVSFLFSVALGVILLVAVTLLWALLDFMGFFSTVAGTIDDITGKNGSGGFDVVAFFSLPRVLGMATILALIDIILITALTTLAAYLYNLSTDLVGGVEVTLAEEE